MNLSGVLMEDKAAACDNMVVCVDGLSVMVCSFFVVVNLF